jgi:hypothetical protein
MFCPNCGAENRAEQNFCRSCGLNLNAITLAVSELFPSNEYARLQRRKELFEKLGSFSLSIAGIIAFSFLIFLAVSYKMILLGPEVLFWSGFGALIGFLLLSIFFFNYPKLFMKFERLDPQTRHASKPEIAAPTAKLIDDRPFEPVPSVTEDSTDLLLTPERRQHK